MIFFLKIVILYLLFACLTNVQQDVLSISDPPGPPENVEVKDITKETCVLTWEVPAFDGGSPILGYHVERRMTSSTRWLKVRKVIPVVFPELNVSHLFFLPVFYIRNTL